MDSKTLRSPIKSLNRRNPICVNATDSVRKVIDTMKQHKIGCVCITRKEKLVGIFTERDILKKVMGSQLDIADTLVEEVMTPNPEYLFEDDQMAFALNRMHMGGFRHIPLVNLEGTPVGVISVRDIAAHVVNSIQGGA